MSASLVGSEMCIRDRRSTPPRATRRAEGLSSTSMEFVGPGSLALGSAPASAPPSAGLGRARHIWASA
eukprot:12682633-Alexandrium_andersonii.AAC.1